MKYCQLLSQFTVLTTLILPLFGLKKGLFIVPLVHFPSDSPSQEQEIRKRHHQIEKKQLFVDRLNREYDEKRRGF